MTKKTTRASQTGAGSTSHANETDASLLTRGDEQLPIVGLGGSAGAIAALQAFFEAMPADSGMAFVVIMHLSPTKESSLAEVFQRSTKMPVVAATDGAKVKPNTVYVIPPGKSLASANGDLRLTDAEEHHGELVAIDHFFRTLAQTHGAQSLAVVFSGAGGDGTLGLKRVKELGGLTIAQDPAEAEHPAMPQSAIATGAADWVLKAHEMPAKLIAHVNQREAMNLSGEKEPHSPKTAPSSDAHEADAHEAALRKVLAFLHTRTGRNFACYQRATIARRIDRRMQVNGLADLPAYLVHLRTHADEAGALLQHLLVSVTSFFRDPASFDALERSMPALFEGKDAGDTVRVWVAGCATGEEAYSIAILLSEHASTLVDSPHIQVFATDLDEESIREARAGLYPETITADVNEERLRHFFVREPGGYRVARALRKLVCFAPHDLLKDPPFSRLDLISCRNLLIYLNREAQSRAFNTFHFALRPGGRLFLGPSESADEASSLFAVLDKKHRLYSQRPAPQRLRAVSTDETPSSRLLSSHEHTRERPATPGRVAARTVQEVLDEAMPLDSGLPSGELHFRLIERFAPPSVLVNAAHDIVHVSASAGRFLHFTGGEPTRNLLRSVLPALRVELRAALYAAARTHAPASALRLPVVMGDARSLVDIRVMPAGDLAPDFLLVVFEAHAADASAAVVAPESSDADQTVLYLEDELAATKARLRETIEESDASAEELKVSNEELQASNEELQAMNEELRSATEELETSREALQSINEELSLVNNEQKANVEQLARSNNDLQNLSAATDIATVFLDGKLQIHRFTPAAKTLFSLIPADLGRPLADISRHLDYPELVADAERSLANLQPVQREVRARERWYIARTLPYRTADDRIAGVVLTFLDITDQKRAAEQIAQLAAESERQRRLYETVLTNTPDFVYVFSLDHKVLYANDALIKMWGRGYDGTIGKTFLEIGYEPVHAEMHSREIDQVRATKQPVHGEVPYNGTNGRRQYEYIFVPVLGADGEVEAVAGTTRDVTERMEAEQINRENDERLRAALTAARMVAWEWTPADRKLRVSENASKVLGLPEGAELTAIDHGLALHHPEDRAGYEATFQRAIEEQESYTTRYRVIRPDDGRTIWMEERGHAVFDQPDGAMRLYGVAADVTDRVLAEQALRASEERSAFVRRSSGVGFWYCDLPFEVLEWDELVKTHFHVPSDAAVTLQTFYDRIHPEDREPTRRAIEQSISDRAPYNVHMRTVNPDSGAITWVRAIGKTSYAADGTPMRFDGVTLDVTEQKRAEESLRESEQRFRVVADAAPALIWLSGTDKLCHWFNQPWLAFTGRSMALEVGNGWVDGVHPDDVERCFQTYSDAFDSRKPFSMEYRLRRHDGEFRWLIDNGVPRYGSGGEFDGYIGSCIDVTDYKNAEAALRDTARRKDEFLATLAHELRNPLAPIRNGLQVMRMAGANETTEQVRSMMERQMAHMVRLVDDLLDASRVTSGKLALRRSRIELRAVVDAAVETSRPAIEEKGHELTVDIPDDPVWVDGDLTRLAQVVSNLLTNSAKYMHLKGQIRLKVGRENGNATVSVADDGIGIPPAMLDQVFETFTQLDRALEKTTGGLGIGLSLAKGLVEMHGGTIDARSEGEGMGSEFVMRLPAVVLSAVEHVAPQEAGEPLNGVSRRILVADDNLDSAESLGQLLELMGNEVVTVNDGLQAVDLAATFRPDVILLDIGMPKLNGFDTCRRIRQQPWSENTVVIALTGWGTDEDRRRSEEAGFDHHLVKPVDFSALETLLAALPPTG